MLSAYHWIYLLSSVLDTYIIFKFMCIFFDRSDVNKKIELSTYVIFYLVSSVTYIAMNIPILNLIVNLVSFFLLSFNYSAKTKKRLTAAIFVYSFLNTIETVIVLLFIYIKLENHIRQIEFVYIIVFLSIRVLDYIMVLVLSRYKMIKEKIELPLLHWFSIIIIPTSSLFLTIVLINHVSNNNYFLIIIGIIILFITNIFVFYLYNSLLKKCKDNHVKALFQQQKNK